MRSGVAAGAVMAAFAAPIAPWAIHVSSEGRFVPVTTGAGKALFIGSYLPGDGIHDRVKIELMERYLGCGRHARAARAAADGAAPRPRCRQVPRPPARRRAEPDRAREPQPLRARAAARGGRDDGQQDALDVARLERRDAVARGVVLQVAILVFAVVGLALLAWQRRFEALLIGGLILGLTVFSGIVLAAPRRNLADAAGDDARLTGVVGLVAYVRAALATRGLQPRLEP